MQGTTVDGGKNAADQEPVDPNKSKMPNPKAARICRGFKKMYARPSEADPVNKRPPQEQARPLIFLIGRRLGLAMQTASAAMAQAQLLEANPEVVHRCCILTLKTQQVKSA